MAKLRTFTTFYVYSLGVTMATSGTTGCTTQLRRFTVAMVTLRHSLIQACMPPLLTVPIPSTAISSK